MENAWDELHHRITIAGGLDVNFLCTATPEEITARSRAMLERTAADGRYMLGSGNSIPTYIPLENYQAMTRAALELD